MSNNVCPWWMAYSFDNPFRSFFHNPEKIFSPYIRNGMTIVDIGCGMGYFSIGMAKMTGEDGKVIALDIQPRMLQITESRALKAGVSEKIKFQLCEENSIHIEEPVDFALTFWMIHETPDIHAFLLQIYFFLKPNGLLFITEPKFHVSRSQFEQELEIANRIGFDEIAGPVVAFSHTAVLEKK